MMIQNCVCNGFNPFARADWAGNIQLFLCVVTRRCAVVTRPAHSARTRPDVRAGWERHYNDWQGHFWNTVLIYLHCAYGAWKTTWHINTFEWKLHGTVTGERFVEIVNSMGYEDIKSGLKAIVCFNNLKKTSYFSWKKTGSADAIYGYIYQSKEKPPLEPTNFGPK